MNPQHIMEEAKLNGVKVFTHDVFEDHRGDYVEIYEKPFYNRAGVNIDFIQDDISTSHKNVLRGIHGDYVTWKLVTCLSGSFYSVILDMNKESSTYRQWLSFDLNDETRKQILIPPGFGNSILSLEDGSVYHYKQSTTYKKGRQFTVRWDDPLLKIDWPIENPILSERDSTAEFLT
jgi:dTDP-4-dehydrorhamnose 3,5-epimerase